jgi:hypothetical protein
MSESIEDTIGIVAFSSWWRYSLCYNDSDNQSINTQNTSHHNGNDVFNNPFGMINTHVTDSHSSSPCSPCRSECGKNHATASTEVPTVKKTRRPFMRFRISILITAGLGLYRGNQTGLSSLGMFNVDHTVALRLNGLSVLISTANPRHLLKTYKTAAHDGHVSIPATTSVMVNRLVLLDIFRFKITLQCIVPVCQLQTARSSVDESNLNAAGKIGSRRCQRAPKTSIRYRYNKYCTVPGTTVPVPVRRLPVKNRPSVCQQVR